MSNTSELRLRIATEMGWVGGDGRDWYPEKTDKVMALLAAQKQRWEAEARLDEVKEAKFYHTNAKSKEWFAQRIPQLEAEIAALDGVIGEPLDGLETPSAPAK